MKIMKPQDISAYSQLNKSAFHPLIYSKNEIIELEQELFHLIQNIWRSESQKRDFSRLFALNRIIGTLK